jgi:hypothetical protein
VLSIGCIISAADLKFFAAATTMDRLRGAIVHKNRRCQVNIAHPDTARRRRQIPGG